MVFGIHIKKVYAIVLLLWGGGKMTQHDYLHLKNV